MNGSLIIAPRRSLIALLMGVAGLFSSAGVLAQDLGPALPVAPAGNVVPQYVIPQAAAPLPTAATPSPAPSSSSGDVTVEQVEAAKHAVEEAPDLDEAARKALLEIYRKALAELKEAADWQAKSFEFETARANAPQELQEWKLRAAQPAAELPPPPKDADVETLKTGLADAEAALKAARDEQAALDGRQRHRSQRREEVRGQDEAAAKRLEELYGELGSLPPLDRADLQAKARRMLLMTRRKSITAERASYAQELPSFEATRELLRLQLDEAVQAVNRAEKQVAVWKEAVDQSVRLAAEARAEEAKRQRITTRGELAPLAQENERIAALSVGPEGPAEQLQRVNVRVKELKRQLARVKAEFAHVRQVSELSHELGRVLVRQRRELPDLGALEEDLRERQEEIGRAKLNILDWEAQRTRLADVAAEAQNVLAPLAANLGPEELAELEPAARDLLQARREYLDDLLSDANAYYNALVLEQDKTERELAQTIRLYRNYIDQRVLWVPSFAPHTGMTAGEITAACVQLIDPRNWGHVVERLIEDARRNPAAWGVSLAIVGLFVYTVRRLRTTIAELGTAAGALDAGMRPTLFTALLTLLAASPAPAVLWFLSARLTAQPGADAFSRAFATTMCVVAPIWATIAVVRQSLRRGGLAERHFGVPSAVAAPARRAIWRLAALALPTAAIAALFDGLEPIGGQASLGRIGFCVAMFCVYRVARLAAHPTQGFVIRLLGSEVDDTRLRLRRLWYFAACLPPLALIGLTIAGYYYASVQLAARLQATVWLLLSCVAVQAVLWRWLAVARRRLARRTAAEAEGGHRELSQPSATSKATPIVAAADAATARRASAHLKAIDVQTRRILNSVGALVLLIGTWGIWSDMLPALQFLDRLQLYSYTTTAAETVAAPDGAAKLVEQVHVRWITGANVAWAAIILAMTIIAARNLPGLLEISCLQWLPMDQGARYAVVAAARYVIHIVGIVAICSSVGLQWSSIQWLAAAMTVGLGFGLQEIFANFISGLIILFERPIRVGDTVTIGEVSGTVSRIRGRATTIVDWDRKELIVPNKEFITGKLINWTLTDDVLRTVIHVSIPASADFDQATVLLLKAAKSNPLVLDEPEPSVAFTQVGDGRLDFDLRVFSSGLDSLTPLRYQLNAAVLRAFHEAGIEMTTGPKEMILRTLDAPPKPEFVAPAKIQAAATLEKAA